VTTVAAELLVHDYAKRLKLPVVGSQASRFAEEAASQRLGAMEFLASLLEAEVHQREANAERNRIAQARFPEIHELSDFDFSRIPSLNSQLVLELAGGGYIERREVVLAVGPPGTGKTHVATALGLAACRQGKRVRFMTVSELVTDLAEAQAEHRLSRLAAQVDRVHLLVLDELGFVKLNSDQAQLLFTLLAHRYIRGGLIVTSNLNFADWTAVFNDDARLTAALLDRITHRCQLLEFHGESYRFRQSLAAREGKLPPPPAPVTPPPHRRRPAPAGAKVG
jgi:DNA replication protein DnaC